ncbi:MAG: hypothetical protein HW412_2629, partial [Bacteroidetes bacterium]|nr:hypothetical protein [Bacteroidota bacterium]
GHAKFEREYDGLNGRYVFTIESIDGRSNSFTLRFAKHEIQLLNAPREKFTELILEPAQK